ncbi:MAG: undecaprenyldiphospho-muramoylpentapeptide beta-N-acetylglucosaminyltransferase [Clostridiaceae bacterium]
MTKVLLTGGGTAGHVMGNLAILPGLLDKGYDVFYVGSHTGLENEIIDKNKIRYYAISSGKLRRFISFQNFLDIFKVAKGILDARAVLKKEKPDVIFSKGGYVTVPVAIAASTMKIPFIGHESDFTPGLANKLAAKFADKMLVTFPETEDSFGEKGITVGSPIRKELFSGKRDTGLGFLGFDGIKPVLLIMGGSMGSVTINNVVFENLDELLKRFDIVHLVGKGNRNSSLPDTSHYRQFEYISDELKDILAATDFVVGRSGSNSIFEFLALKLPNLLIPLDLEASRGDQILNAESFKKMGYSMVLREKDITHKSFIGSLDELIQRKDEFKKNMENTKMGDAVDKILKIIDDTLKNKGKTRV